MVVQKQALGPKRKRKRGASNDGAPRGTNLAGLEPTEEEIRRRAYEIYLGRSGVSGDPVADWLQAERGLRDERNTQNVSLESSGARGGRGRGKAVGRGRSRGERVE
jgi:hypothetical protein